MSIIDWKMVSLREGSLKVKATYAIHQLHRAYIIDIKAGTFTQKWREKRMKVIRKHRGNRALHQVLLYQKHKESIQYDHW